MYPLVSCRNFADVSVSFPFIETMSSQEKELNNQNMLENYFRESSIKPVEVIFFN